MNAPTLPEPDPHPGGETGKSSKIRRFRSEMLRPGHRSPLVNMSVLTVLLALVLFLIYQFFFDPIRKVSTNIIDLSQSVEYIQELSTVKSHYRFGVVVQEEGGNIVVRRLADQAEYLGMNSIGSALFHSPAMIVELHGVATFGIRLDSVGNYITQNDTALFVTLPPAEILDAHLISGDTKIVAHIQGLFRGGNKELLLEASKKGEEFVRAYAEQDMELRELSRNRAQNIISMLAKQNDKQTVFE